jgi:hypothetical protein
MPWDRFRSILSTRSSRSPSRRAAISPRLAAESAASRTTSNVCSAANSDRRHRSEVGAACHAAVVVSTIDSPAASNWWTSAELWCRRGSGLAGPRMPANGLARRIPSVVAHDNARRTSRRCDTIATDAPARCQRRMAARTSPGDSVTSRRRPSSSATRARTAGRWLTKRGRLPQVGRVEEPLHQLPHAQPGGRGREVHPGDPEVDDQLCPASLGEPAVTVHGERALHAPAVAWVKADHHPHLPHARSPFPQRTGTSPHPPRRTAIPITRRHPYSYRDSYRDAPPRPRPASCSAGP